jgi:hypothetical protein
MRETRQFRGISRRLAVQYLETIGGDRVDEGPVDEGPTDEDQDDEGPIDENRVEGDGWTATLSEETVPVAGSIELTEVTIVFEGDRERLEPVIETFARKAMRAGG